MKTCKSCKFYVSIPNNNMGHCDNKFLGRQCSDIDWKTDSKCIVNPSSLFALYVGEDFGCVHHSGLEEEIKDELLTALFEAREALRRAALIIDKQGGVSKEIWNNFRHIDCMTKSYWNHLLVTKQKEE